MAEIGEKIITQAPRLIGDIATGALSIMRQLAELQLLNDQLNQDKRTEIGNDIQLMDALIKDADHLSEKQQEQYMKLNDKYSSIIIPETDFLAYKEKLDDKGIEFTTLDVKNANSRLLLFNKIYKEEIEKTKEAVFAENFYINEISGRQLRALAKQEGKKILEISGLGKYEIDLFRLNAKNFKFAVLGDEKVTIMAKDLDKAEDLIQRNAWELTSPIQGALTKEALDYDRDFYRELHENLTIPNGKTIYVCSRENDEYMEIGDKHYSLYKYGKLIERQNKGEKDFNSLLMYQATRGIINPVIVSQEEFEKNFEMRKKILSKKSLRPSRTYITEKEKMDLAKAEERDSYFRNLLMEKKLGLENEEESKVSVGVYDFLVSFERAEEHEQINEDFKEQLIEKIKIMDLDDKEEYMQLISGLSAEEIGAISDHVQDYADLMQGIKITEYEIEHDLDLILNDEVPGIEVGDRYDVDDKNYNGMDDHEEEL